jgi:hypothetical protein
MLEFTAGGVKKITAAQLMAIEDKPAVTNPQVAYI